MPTLPGKVQLNVQVSEELDRLLRDAAKLYLKGTRNQLAELILETYLPAWVAKREHDRQELAVYAPAHTGTELGTIVEEIVLAGKVDEMGPIEPPTEEDLEAEKAAKKRVVKKRVVRKGRSKK